VVAGLAVSGLNFIKVKEKITTIQGERESERTQKEAAQTELASTKKDLSETRAELKTTKETLATTTEERDRAVAEAASQTRRAHKLTDDLNKTRRERDDAQAELAAYKLTELNRSRFCRSRTASKGCRTKLPPSRPRTSCWARRSFS
jgi:chromosome segregation ATPase